MVRAVDYRLPSQWEASMPDLADSNSYLPNSPMLYVLYRGEIMSRFSEMFKLGVVMGVGLGIVLLLLLVILNSCLA